MTHQAQGDRLGDSESSRGKRGALGCRPPLPQPAPDPLRAVCPPLAPLPLGLSAPPSSSPSDTPWRNTGQPGLAVTGLGGLGVVPVGG